MTKRKASKGNEWAKIITALGRYKQGFTRADIETVAKRFGKPMQCARFVQAGIFTRLDRGLYKVAKPARTAK
jgi:hypothetical protein